MKIHYVAPHNKALEEKLDNATREELITMASVGFVTTTALYRALMANKIIKISDFDKEYTTSTDILEKMLDETRRVAAMKD